ncbi:MAG: hypothetical protein BZ135_03215 [Methanosphaera sp. rholeuAM6]|nr:MAG: hypothetical protein BZ135_03215 [Methanosphaera sp. rholeuAM6]
MSFLGDGLTTMGICGGVCIGFILIIAVSSFIIDYDPSTTIENNTTIELNGVTITVPQTNNYTINENASLWNINDTDKFGFDNNITKENAYQYHDYVNRIDVYVADNNRTAYSDIPDYSDMDVFDGDSGRTHIEKRTVGDKTVFIYVTEGKGLSKRIVDSARIS